MEDSRSPITLTQEVKEITSGMESAVSLVPPGAGENYSKILLGHLI